MQDKPENPDFETQPFQPEDREGNRLSRRVQRYARVGSNVGGIAARIGANYLLGGADRQKNASQLAAALGGLKGPLMKVAQLISTIPDAIPPEYAAELGQLQNMAPPMGWPFVRRRMAAELGPDWRAKFTSFGEQAAAAASLGPGSQGDEPRWPSARGEAAISRDAISGGSRSQSASHRNEHL